MNEDVRKARWLAMLAIALVALYVCWLMLKPFIAVLGWAVVLVMIFYPLHRRLLRRIKRPGLSALISSILVILVFVAPLVFVIASLMKELGTAAQDLPALLSRVVHPATPVLGKVSKAIQDRFALDAVTLEALIVEQLKYMGSLLLGQSLGLVGNLLGGIAKTFFVVITMYYLFRDGDKIVTALPAALPFSYQQSQAIIARTSEIVSASVYGVVTIAMLQALLAGLAFSILGVPSPILWAVLLGFICLIPIAASFFVWLPAAIYLMLTGHWTKGILLILWGTLVISTIDNLLRPKIMKAETKLHELFIFFSVLGGISLFGLLGIVLGPVILGVTLALVQTFAAGADEKEKPGALPEAPPLQVSAAKVGRRLTAT
jgi:predicted PurR-regulated permease PerM